MLGFKECLCFGYHGHIFLRDLIQFLSLSFVHDELCQTATRLYFRAKSSLAVLYHQYASL